LRYADLFKQGEHAIDRDEVYDELKKHFSEEEIIELGMLCAQTHGVGKLVKSFNVLSWDDACVLNPKLIPGRYSCRLLKSEITQGWVIVGTATQWPVILAFTLLDWQVIDAGDAQVHQPVFIELPVLVAIAAEPIAAIVVPFVGEANRDSILAEGPNLLDQAIIKLAIPFAGQKSSISARP
jgi:hypothetical protein